jgi:hypothetical protein
MTSSAARSPVRRPTISTTPALFRRYRRRVNAPHTRPPSSLRRWRAALPAAAAILAGCVACAILPPSHPTRAHPRPAASRTRPAGPAADVAALLPVSPAQLQTAAALAARFAATYGTHRSGEPPSAWLARLAPMATSQLTGALTRAATTPATAQQWAQPVAGQAVAEQIRDLTATSLIFTVRVREAITSGAGRRVSTDDLAITVSRWGGGWAVYDVEPAAAGDTGGPSGATAGP